MSAKVTTPRLLSISIGIVYLWFGILKFFPGLSPAEGLASETMRILTFNLWDTDYSLMFLAFWETLAGLLLLTNAFRAFAIPLALVHIAFTFTPLLFFPDKAFAGSPFLPTLLGQYIAKNIIIVSVLLVLWKECREARRVSKKTLISQMGQS
jgi:uncharacterized membrane protein YkgB